MTEESCFPRMLMVANPQKEAENEQIIMGHGVWIFDKEIHAASQKISLKIFKKISHLKVDCKESFWKTGSCVLKVIFLGGIANR